MKAHFQRKFLAGILAAIPLAVTAIITWYIDSQVRALFPAVRYPFLGILLALVAIYILGVFVTSLVGQWLIGLLDWVLVRLPGLSDLYRTWKQIAVTPDGDAGGIFAKVVLVPDDSGQMRMLGFTTGRPVDGAPDTVCVYVPASPNPATGRLYFVAQDRVRYVQVGAQEALKFAISGGNYVPPAVGASLAGK